MGTSDDVSAAGGGDEDLADWCSLLHGDDLEARNGSLESVDRIDLSDEDTSTHRVQSLSATLPDITEASDDSNLASNHDIGGTLDAVDQRLPAAVQVVELRLCNGIVHVDGWAQETVVLVLQHAVEVVDTSGGLLRDAVAALELLWVLLVYERGQIATVVEDKVELLAILKGGELLLEAPLVLLLSLTLPGEAILSSDMSHMFGLAVVLHWNT